MADNRATAGADSLVETDIRPAGRDSWDTPAAVDSPAAEADIHLVGKTAAADRAGCWAGPGRSGGLLRKGCNRLQFNQVGNSPNFFF